MFSIGEFARHGRVSVRMLRHYDAIGLLRPASTEAETARLARVEARLMTIEAEVSTPADGVVLKRLPAVRVAELTGTAAGFEPEAIAPVIQPLYDQLWCQLATAGVDTAGPALAHYEDSPAGDGGVVVHAAVPVVADAGGEHGFTVVDLASVESAAAIIHHGSMNDVLSTGQALARWIDASGYRSAGYVREVTLDWNSDPAQWVTELQQPIYAP